MKDAAFFVVLIFWLMGLIFLAFAALNPACADDESETSIKGHVNATVVSSAVLDDEGDVTGEEQPADITTECKDDGCTLIVSY